MPTHRESLHVPALAPHLVACCLSLLAPACGSSSPEAKAPSSSPAAASAAAAPAAPSAPAPTAAGPRGMPPLPTQCAAGQAEGICAPPADFVRWLCEGYPKPDIALVLFAKGSPWTRAFMNRNVEAWYTSGPESTKAKLIFDEEIIVLRHPKAGGGIIVGEGSPYDVFRWDGICASVGSEEVTHKRPPAPKHPSIPWQQLERNVRDALDKDPGILRADASRMKECKGTTGLGMMSAACVKADDKLSQVIVDYISGGGKSPLPQPSR